MRAGDLQVREIAAMLNARADVLAPQLLREGRKDGNFFRCGSIAGERGQSMAVNLQGPRKGCWTDWSAAEGADDYSGDMLGLVAVTQYGSQQKEALRQAIQWAKQWLGLDDAAPTKVREIRRDIRDAQQQADAQAEQQRQERLKWARGLWVHSKPILDTPVLAYLKGRGIDFGPLGKLPGSLRYHPQVWCPVRRGKFPAMVACIMALDGQLLAVHRTYLDVAADGAVRVVKVARDPATGQTRIAQPGDARTKSHKLTIGQYQGGCIPLWKGSCSKTLRDITQGTQVFVSEGIEDGLSLAVSAPDRRVVAAVAIANMGGLQLPEQAGALVLVGQNDPLDSKALQAFERAIARQQQGGRQVKGMFPPAGVKDFNELLMRGGA